MAPTFMMLLRRRPAKEPPPPEDWPRGTVELDGRSFRDFVERYPLVVVEFWASWCAPCKAMRPIIRDLAEAYRGRVAFGKVNIERHRDLAEEHGVMSIPLIAFFSYGKGVGTARGKLSRRRLEGKVASMAKRHGQGT